MSARHDAHYEQCSTEPLQLGRLKNKGRVRVCTLSWSDEAKDQPRGHFLASLGGSSRGVDLLMAAGRPVRTVPRPATILDASGGVPVLFEARTMGVWQVAHDSGSGPKLSTIRHGQLVYTATDEATEVRRLLDVVGRGEGRICFAGSDVKLLLLICGENNVLRARPASVFKVMDQRYRQRLGERWVTLNPAHGPYWPRNKYSGFSKIGAVPEKGGTVGPTLEAVVRGTDECRDGSAPPLAIVHANQWRDGHEVETVPNCARAFTREGLLEPRRTPEVLESEGARFTSSVFDLPV